MRALQLATIVAVALAEFDQITIEDIDGEMVPFGWVKVMECSEGLPAPYYWQNPDTQSLTAKADSVKIIPKNGAENPRYFDFAVMAKPDSNAITALRDGYELSYLYDADATPNRVGFADVDEWIGSDTAKARLSDSCGPDSLRSFDRVIYAAHCNGNGLHVWTGGCLWEWSNRETGEDMEIYFGFIIRDDTTAEPTTSTSTSTAEPTTPAPITAQPTTSTTTSTSTSTAEPTTSEPTTAQPTTAAPITAVPTTSKPTTSDPTTSTSTSTSSSTTTASPTAPSEPQIPSWADEVTIEVFSGESKEIGWVKVIACEEGVNNPYSFQHQSIKELASDAYSVKIVPVGSTANPAYDDFAVVAVPFSNVMKALNDYKELSWKYDPNVSPNNIGFADLDNWIGTDAAKSRLKDGCGVNGPGSKDVADFGGVVYAAQCNGKGMHIWPNSCRWEFSNLNLGQDIEIYFGYSMGEPTEEPTAEPTWHDNPVIELPWSTDRVQQWADVWIVNSDPALTGTGTLLDEADLTFMADTYQVVSLEKCLRGADGNGFTEDRFYELYNGLKDRNPEMQVLYYWNLPHHYADCYTHMGLELPDDPYLYDDDGNGPLWEGLDYRFAWDLRKPEVRAFHVDYIELVARGNPVERDDDGGIIDGLFLDGMCAWLSNFGYTGANGEHIRTTWTEQSLQDYNAAIVELLRAIKERVPELFLLGNGMFQYGFMIPNPSLYTGLNDDGYCSHVLPFVDGICLEHFGAFEEVGSNGLVNPALFKEWVHWSNDIIVQEKYGPGKHIFVKAWPGPVNNIDDAGFIGALWKETDETLAAFGPKPTTIEEARECAAKNLDWVVAAYLCGVHHERVYISYTWWYRFDQGPLPGDDDLGKYYMAPEEWYPQLERYLGPALGDGVFISEYECVREFENAYVSVDLSDPTSALIVWESTSPTTATPTAAPVPTMQPTPAPTFDVPDWADEAETVVDIDGVPRDIGWIKVFSCEEGTGSYVWEANGANLKNSDLADTAISVKIVPAGSVSNPEYDNFAVTAKPGSNVIVALNDRKELSFQYDPNASPNLVGQADPGNWIGTPQALKRLINSCFHNNPDGNVLDFNMFYQGCGNQLGLHLWAGSCKWQFNDPNMGQDIEMYFGYDLYGDGPN